MRVRALLASLFFLTSCAGMDSPAARAAALEAGYDAAIAAAIAYASLPRCPPGGMRDMAHPCADPALIAEGNTLAHAAWLAITAAKQAAGTGTAGNAANGDAIAAAEAALAALRGLLAKLPAG